MDSKKDFLMVTDATELVEMKERERNKKSINRVNIGLDSLSSLSLHSHSQGMPADWMAESNSSNPPQWRDPHERSYYKEHLQPTNPLLHPTTSFTPRSHPNSNLTYPNSFTGMSKHMEDKQRRLQDSLDKVLGPDYVQNRPGGGGTKLTYLEGWRAINLANEVFGYNGELHLSTSLLLYSRLLLTWKLSFFLCDEVGSPISNTSK